MARTTIRTEDITASAVTAAKIASGAVDTAGLEDDVALLGFKVASNGSLAKYNLVDQTVDAFEDTSGVNAGGSTNEIRDSSGKYYFGGSVGDATGGTITESGGNTIHTFTSSGTFTVPGGSSSVAYLVIAGGGGAGGGEHGGGGGGGGYRNSFASETSGGGGSTETPLTMTSGAYTVTVGGGGDGKATYLVGDDGVDSVFSTITSTGGGGGGTWRVVGRVGGSGGGGGGGNREVIAGGSGTSNQGYAGGAYTNTDATNGAGGGGGGASAVGQDTAASYTGASGNGGAGLSSSITGASVGRGGGGGGSGGSGGTATDGGGARPGGDGTANTGGGGAGQVSDSGSGGSGIVIASYTTDSFVSEGSNLTLVSTTTAAQAAPTKGDIVLTYTNGAGTTTLDTDLTAEISADGGSTWTALALGSEGSTGSHNIATSHDVTISSTITSPWNMAYRIKTLNQSGSKTTRIQAVSLGWS